MTRAIPILLATLLGSGCIVTEGRHGPDETPVVRATTPKRMWNVVHGEEVVGSVVLYESDSDSFFAVRNEWQQDVGLVDRMGRAWAYRPHGQEAEWLGSGSVSVGAGLILELEGEAELQEVPLPSAAGGR